MILVGRSALQTGKWYHFAQVVQGSSASDSSAVHKIYIDGQLSLTNTINLSGRGSNSIACIASRTNNSVYGGFILRSSFLSSSKIHQ